MFLRTLIIQRSSLIGDYYDSILHLAKSLLSSSLHLEGSYIYFAKIAYKEARFTVRRMIVGVASEQSLPVNHR